MWKENHLYENSIEHLGKNDKGNQLKDAIKLAVRETNVKTVKISYKSSSLNSKYSESLLRSCSLFKKLPFIYLSSISSMGLVSLQLSSICTRRRKDQTLRDHPLNSQSSHAGGGCGCPWYRRWCEWHPQSWAVCSLSSCTWRSCCCLSKGLFSLKIKTASLTKHGYLVLESM